MILTQEIQQFSQISFFNGIQIVQGVRGQSGVFNLALRERNIQVRL